MRNRPDLKRLIPITRIRHLYDLLRDVERQAVHMSMARELVRKPQPLFKILEESRLHFEKYDNAAEGFHPRQPVGRVTPAFLASLDPADVVTTRLAREPATFTSTAPPFEYVDYEVNQLRTTGTGSIAENGLSLYSSIDLLLCDAADHYPIVGEIKAVTDRNPFLALIQSLTYAVELSTEAQQRRLKTTYPDSYKFAPDSPAIGIALIRLGDQKGTNSGEFSQLAEKLARAVVRETDGWLRRITFYTADLTAAGVSISSDSVP